MSHVCSATWCAGTPSFHFSRDLENPNRPATMHTVETSCPHRQSLNRGRTYESGSAPIQAPLETVKYWRAMRWTVHPSPIRRPPENKSLFITRLSYIIIERGLSGAECPESIAKVA